MPKKKYLQTYLPDENLEFLSDSEIINKIKQILKEKLTVDMAMSIPKIQQILFSEHLEEFRRKQYKKLENIYKTHWYRYKFYGFLEKDEYAYSFDTFFDLIYNNITKQYDLEIIYEDEDLLLEVFEELGLKNDL